MLTIRGICLFLVLPFPKAFFCLLTVLSVYFQAAGVQEILFEPDFVAYQKVYSTVCELIFSASCIEAKGVAAHGDRENFHIYLKIDDIVEIESQWLGRVILHFVYFNFELYPVV